MSVFVCPLCAILVRKEKDGDAIKISYEYSMWSAWCAHNSVSSLLLCPRMQPVLQLTQTDERNLAEIRGKPSDK
jgi:hypothetical protein